MRTAALLLIAVVCAVALITPIITNMLLGRDEPLSGTDPAALILVGLILIVAGLITRGTNIFRK